MGRYDKTVDRLLSLLDADRLDAAVEIAELPERIRGFGMVKQRHVRLAREREAALLAAYEADRPAPRAACCSPRTLFRQEVLVEPSVDLQVPDS
jgi:indolepyruvate ferredoxin oxidoreductase